jgi:hypothetical protein
VALNSDTGIGRNAAGVWERMFISVSCGVPVGVMVSPGLLLFGWGIVTCLAYVLEGE